MAAEIDIWEPGVPKDQSHGREVRIAETATAQHGLIALRQLLGLGLSRRAVTKRVASGRLHRIHRGVFAVGHRDLTHRGWMMAAVLACGAAAVLSHRPAGAEWNLLSWSGAAEVLVPSARRGPDGVIVRSASLPADEITVHHGFPITTVPRTILDLASVLPADRLLNVINEAEEQELGDPLSLPAMIERHAGERGTAKLRAVLRDAGYGITKRELEARFARFVTDFSLPRPRRNAPIWVGDGSYVADCLWPTQRVIIELHSARHHSTMPKVTRDATRDRRLLLAGYIVIHVTWAQLHDPREARSLASDLRRLLGLGAPIRRRTRAPSGRRRRRT